MEELAENSEENDISQQEMMFKEAFEMAEKQLNEVNEKIKSLEQNVEEESPEDVDDRSVFVGNVEYTASPDEVQEHFKESGTINRVTILCDKFTGHPKGFAYVEFQDKDSIQQALLLNDSMFKGRKIKVSPKRTNIPNMARGRRMRRRSSIYGVRGRWMYVRPPRRYGRFRPF